MFIINIVSISYLFEGQQTNCAVTGMRGLAQGLVDALDPKLRWNGCFGEAAAGCMHRPVIIVLPRILLTLLCPYSAISPVARLLTFLGGAESIIPIALPVRLSCHGLVHVC